MDIRAALLQAAKEMKWSRTRLAFEAGVTESAVRKWLVDGSIPTSDKLEILRAKMPVLRRILDAQSASIRIEDPRTAHAA